MSRVRTAGATTMRGVPPDVLARLEAGTAETRTLAEGLAVRMDRLLGAAIPALAGADLDVSLGIVGRMARAGELLRTLPATELADLARHPSDTVRGWVAFAWGQDAARPPLERIAQMRALAADPHFGVREWAWLAVRGAVIAETDAAVALLAGWAAHPDPNVRRFASEATRPRGVWSPHVPLLRREPARGLPILEPLRRDPTRYVEDSVANWLNDAGKDDPAWLRALLACWERDGAAPRLIRRAGRSLAPASPPP